MKSAQAKSQLFDDLRDLLKARAEQLQADQAAASHPDADELAAFSSGRSNRTATAAHVAACQSCSEEVALFARAERAAAELRPNRKEAGEIPAAAWQMIRDWEGNSLARPKAQSETLSAELLTRLARLIADRKEVKAGRKAVTRTAPNQVPVIVLNRQGDFRGVELFEKSEGRGGDITLKPVDPSSRFDKRELHALLHQGRKQYDVESFPIERNRVRIKSAANQDTSRADYFIIED